MYPQRSVMTCGLATALEPPHFNHAPVRGAIGASFSRRSRAGSFNPRTRVGCDEYKQGRYLHFDGFNPRTRVGCDTGLSAARDAQLCFNPRTRVGCDLANQKEMTCETCFNPRTRVGCDIGAGGGALPCGPVSIHAPAWGATRLCYVVDRQAPAVSIHAPAWGATCITGVTRGEQRRFQSTHPRGVRRVVCFR